MMILIFLVGDLTLARRMARKRKKKMKLDEQDRVRNHALGFSLAFFF